MFSFINLEFYLSTCHIVKSINVVCSTKQKLMVYTVLMSEWREKDEDISSSRFPEDVQHDLPPQSPYLSNEAGELDEPQSLWFMPLARVTTA